MIEIGVIADTHDLVRPELLAALDGVARILHAGDVCTLRVLDELAEIAPVTAVRGNNDPAGDADHGGNRVLTLPEALALRIEEVRIWMCHAREDLGRLPPPPDTDLVIVGHSHKPFIDRTSTPILLNPGSPGRRRFKLPVSCARLRVHESDLDIRLIELDVPPARPRRSSTERTRAGATRPVQTNGAQHA